MAAVAYREPIRFEIDGETFGFIQLRGLNAFGKLLAI